MATSKHRGTEVIIYEAATQGNSPADDSTTYDASGDRIHTVGEVDITSIDQALVEDERSVSRIFERAGQMVRGLRNTSITLSTYLTGKEATTADGSQATETALARLLEHGLGGIKRGNSTTAKVAGTHTTTSIELTSATNWEAGMLVGVIDASDNRGLVHIRRIIDLTVDVITLDRALPFTPVDGDKVVGGITIYCDQDVLEDSGAGSNRTHSIFVRKGGSSGTVRELLGCKAALSLAALNRGELPTVALEYQCATFRTAADDGTGDVSAISSTPSFSGTLNGAAPLHMGRDTSVYLDDYGSTSATSKHVNGLEVGLGVTVAPIETVTSATASMEGLAGWTLSKPDPTASMTIVPHGSEWETDLQGGTYKAFAVERRGAEGSAFAIVMPRCEVSSTPKTGDNGEVLAEQVTLRAHEDQDSVGTTDVAKSPILIGLF